MMPTTPENTFWRQPFHDYWTRWFTTVSIYPKDGGQSVGPFIKCPFQLTYQVIYCLVIILFIFCRNSKHFQIYYFCTSKVIPIYMFVTFFLQQFPTLVILDLNIKKGRENVVNIVVFSFQYSSILQIILKTHMNEYEKTFV